MTYGRYRVGSWWKDTSVVTIATPMHFCYQLCWSIIIFLMPITGHNRKNRIRLHAADLTGSRFATQKFYKYLSFLASYKFPLSLSQQEKRRFNIFRLWEGNKEKFPNETGTQPHIERERENKSWKRNLTLLAQIPGVGTTTWKRSQILQKLRPHGESSQIFHELRPHGNAHKYSRSWDHTEILTHIPEVETTRKYYRN